MADKIFCGSAKIIQTQYGEMTKGSFSREDLQKLTDNLNEKGYVNWNLKEKKNKVEGKATHYIEIDDWKPKGVQQSAVESSDNGTSSAPADDDLPF